KHLREALQVFNIVALVNERRSGLQMSTASDPHLRNRRNTLSDWKDHRKGSLVVAFLLGGRCRELRHNLRSAHSGRGFSSQRRRSPFGPVACSEPVCSAAGGVEAENDEEGSLTLQLDAPTREQKSKIQRMAQ
ncbi:MAG: hypothetical protein WA717_01820, partial [Methyloceanibacter sp.]